MCIDANEAREDRHLLYLSLENHCRTILEEWNESVVDEQELLVSFVDAFQFDLWAAMLN